MRILQDLLAFEPRTIWWHQYAPSGKYSGPGLQFIYALHDLVKVGVLCYGSVEGEYAVNNMLNNDMLHAWLTKLAQT